MTQYWNAASKTLLAQPDLAVPIRIRTSLELTVGYETADVEMMMTE